MLYLFSSKGAPERIQLVLAHPSRQGREKAKKLGRKPSEARQRSRNHSHFTVSCSAFSLQVPVLTPLNSPIFVALGPHKEEKTGQEPRAQEKNQPPNGSLWGSITRELCAQGWPDPTDLNWTSSLTATLATSETIPGQKHTFQPRLPTSVRRHI